MARCAGSASLRLLPLLGLVCVACKSAPTTLLVHIQTGSGLPEPDELRLNVFGELGAAVRDRRLPEAGKPVLPGEVVLYPNESRGALRVWVRALRGNAAIGDGATVATLEPGKQVEATVLIAALLPDRDGDGVPDAVDSCPDRRNPDQGACPAPDLGPGDAGRDAARQDVAREARVDLPQCDVDGDGHQALSCGGEDCDDKNPLVHPKRQEGPPGDSTCGDKLDNDCDGGVDLADTECRTCAQDSDCDDKSVCTNDSCVSGQCKNAPANNGAICDDGNACTSSTTCQAGSCGGGTPVSCPVAPACRTASCDPQKGCVTTNVTDGAGCDDGLYCTVSDACKSGSCVGAARDCTSGVPACKTGSCNEAQDRCDTASLTDGVPCDDKDPCTQGESCKAGSCQAPALLDEQIGVGNIANAIDRTIRVDSKGKVHVVVTAHNGSVATAIRYHTNVTGSWSTEQVGAVGGSAGGYPSLVLDASDQPHVTFANRTTNLVQYARRASGGPGWTVSDLGPGQGPTSLALDPAGTLHAGYLASGQLRYAVKGAAATAWQSYPVYSTIVNTNEAELSLALDGSGKPQLAFGDGADPYGGRLRHASMGAAPASWTVEEPPGLPTAMAAYHPSLAITSAGTVQIAHFSVTLSPVSATLHLTRRVGTTWSSQTVSSANGSPQYAGLFCALTLDSKGNAQVAYRDSLVDELRFATNLTGAWTSTVLAKGGNVGRWLSLARAASGALHVFYEREAGYLMRHAAFSACP